MGFQPSESGWLGGKAADSDSDSIADETPHRNLQAAAPARRARDVVDVKVQEYVFMCRGQAHERHESSNEVHLPTAEVPYFGL